MFLYTFSFIMQHLYYHSLKLRCCLKHIVFKTYSAKISRDIGFLYRCKNKVNKQTSMTKQNRRLNKIPNQSWSLHCKEGADEFPYMKATITVIFLLITLIFLLIFQKLSNISVSLHSSWAQ